MALPTASDNVFPKLILDGVTSDPAAPTDDSWKVYAKPNGLYARSSNAVYGPIVMGSALANPMTTTGDIIYSSDGSGTAARRAIGSNGTALFAIGSTPDYKNPPGFILNQVRSSGGNISITATTEATADTIITAAAVTLDGSTDVDVEFGTPFSAIQATSGAHLILYLYDGSTSMGIVWQATNNAATTLRVGGIYITVPLAGAQRPSAAAHTYSIRAATGSGTSLIGGGPGGAGQYQPRYIRIKVA